ncbi:hypothetical protein NDU88_003013 [Pleurodeles waltl]|uniref:Uncharacterized protein n=1 Tax=Pleurodeles waltl TaxID=8319 RepID=A0AAV7Q8G8_PLEWA|nr:hypothetical protein NDU88_003013 [Pleurodeles waltl]
MRLDHMKQQVGKHETRLGHLENRVSDADNTQADSKEHLLRMDKILDLIKAKNEDLESRHQRNNLMITGNLESTAVNKMNFVEAMLRDLFGEALFPVFIVEPAHCSLRPPTSLSYDFQIVEIDTLFYGLPMSAS